MHIYAQKPNAPRQTASTKVSMPNQSHHGQSRAANSTLHLQRTLGSQTVQRLFDGDSRNIKGDSLTESAPLVHDFSGIPVHPRPCNNLQPKLKVSTPGDQFEREADRVADAVVRMPEPGRTSELKGITSIQHPADSGKITQRLTTHRRPLLADADHGESLPTKFIQRESMTDEPPGAGEPIRGEEDEEEPVLMAKAIEAPHSAPRTPPNSINKALDAIPHSGEPLHPGLRSYFEPRFGHDFRQVRIHTGAQTARVAQALNARAFTYGNNIVFNNSEYNPGTRRGMHLIAHELTHTVQQTGGTPHIVGERTQPGVIQRAQIGRITQPPSGTPYFVYELDATVPNFTMLATYYGVDVGDITAMNPGVSASIGTRVNVPAFNPPASVSGSFGGAGLANIVTGSNVNVRWSPVIASNRLGQLNNGNTIPEVFSAGHGVYSSAFVDQQQLALRADGVINELRRLNLVSGPSSIGNYVLGYVPTANITQRTTLAVDTLSYALGEHATGVVENPACTNRGTDVDKYTGVTGRSPVISGNRVRSGRCGRPWCAYFVKWCLGQAGVPNTVNGGAVSVKNWGSSRSWYHLVSAITPMRGDIFYKQPSCGGTHPCDTNPCVRRGCGTGHVGFVTGVSGTNVQTVEGNVNVSATNDGINTLTRPLSDLEGVVRIP